MCHTLLSSSEFFQLLLRIDQDLANEVYLQGCSCGGVLHKANYPRKPRGCLATLRWMFCLRFSFCCYQCRRRHTPRSVRFLGRRVYIALVIVLVSNRPATLQQASLTLQVPANTLRRWARWWREDFPQTRFWQAYQGYLMPPVDLKQLPASLLVCFTGQGEQSLQQLL